MSQTNLLQNVTLTSTQEAALKDATDNAVLDAIAKTTRALNPDSSEVVAYRVWREELIEFCEQFLDEDDDFFDPGDAVVEVNGEECYLDLSDDLIYKIALATKQ